MMQQHYLHSEETLSPLAWGGVATGKVVCLVTGRSAHCLVFSLGKKSHHLLLQRREE